MSEMISENTIEKVSTGIIGADDNDNFLVTQKAIETINNVRKQNEVPSDYYLRIGTNSGGCSGMSYAIGFDPEVKEIDRVLELNDISFVVDNKSLFYLMGVTLDFVDGPSGSGFVFNNPSDAPTCGCSH